MCERIMYLMIIIKKYIHHLIQPGVYTRNEIIEPVDSNIGISFTQQFEPTTCSIDKDGNTEFIST